MSFAAVTLDVGGTLIQPHPSVGHVYAAVAARCGCGIIEPAGLDRQFRAAWMRKKVFAYTKEEWRQLVLETFQDIPAALTAPDLFEKIYAEFQETHAWHIFPDVRATLARLSDAGLKLAIISNWDERLRPLLAGLELSHFFEAMIISHEVGAAKPAAALFQEATRRLATAPEMILHVGDSPVEDCAGARAVGMQALLLDRGSKADEEGVIGSLSVLPGRLGI